MGSSESMNKILDVVHIRLSHKYILQKFWLSVEMFGSSYPLKTYWKIKI